MTIRTYQNVGKPTYARHGDGTHLSDEQKRIWSQVEVIQSDIENLEIAAQPAHRKSDAVDKETGEIIPFHKKREMKERLLTDKDGRVLNSDEYHMQKEGWGRPIAQPASGSTWNLNANIGIRTQGEDALDIKLVETKNGDPIGDEDKYGEPWRDGEKRRWEYQISRKGQDATKPENVLHVPVFSAHSVGLLADIGNKGSSYTSDHYTGKSFQAQKVLRNADDIAITVPYPTSNGTTLAILDRNPFEAFVKRKAIRGGTITVPNGSTDHVAVGYHSVLAQIDGGPNAWGAVLFSGPRNKDEKDALKGTLYEQFPLPQDELVWKEEHMRTRPQAMRERFLNVPAEDGQSAVAEGSALKVFGNTCNGPQYTIDGGESKKIPPHGGDNAWNSAPVWVHGPGEKGTIDLTGLDGRIILDGGGTIKISQKPAEIWWYTDLILAGGTPDKKAVYTIEIPQFDDPKLKLNLDGKPGERKFHLQRYPMPLGMSIPLQYPDGTDVQIGQTENDYISIQGGNIEVRVKEGDKIRTIYDSDKPDLSQTSAVLRPSGHGLSGITFASGMAALGSSTPVSRRGMLAASLGLGLSLLPDGSNEAAPQKGIQLSESRVQAFDPATAPLSAMMPDLSFHADGKCLPRSKPQATQLKQALS